MVAASLGGGGVGLSLALRCPGGSQAGEDAMAPSHCPSALGPGIPAEGLGHESDCSVQVWGCLSNQFLFPFGLQPKTEPWVQ